MCNRLWGATILAGLLTWQAATRADDVVRLPPVGPTNSASEVVATSGAMPEQPAEGTWREDGQHVIINLDGREIRLAKAHRRKTRAASPAEASQPAAPSTVGSWTGGILWLTATWCSCPCTRRTGSTATTRIGSR